MQASVFARIDVMSEALPFTKDSYEFLELIGRGGFSRVFLVRSLVYNQEFVAKVMPKSLVNDGVHLDLSLLKNLENPFIIRVYQQFDDEENHYLIMEYCKIGTVRSYLEIYGRNNSTLLRRVIYQILMGFKYVHSAGVAHRDIKPSNILVDDYGRPKIIDFGIGVKAKRGSLIRIQSGTDAYKAPEVSLGQMHDPFLADVWSLGVTFFVLSMGELPWSGLSAKRMQQLIEQGHYHLPEGMDPEISSLIRSMIQVDPRKRPSLDAILASHISLAPISSISRSLITKYRSSPRVLVPETSCFPQKKRRSSQLFLQPLVGVAPLCA